MFFMCYNHITLCVKHEKVQCWISNDASKPEVIEKIICEGTDYLHLALQSDMTSLHVMVASARSVDGGEQ